jgi:hypothetical protein
MAKEKECLTMADEIGNALRILLILGCALLASRSEARPNHDYVFGITGVVVTEDGAPLQNAQVTLQVTGPVYSGVETVKKEEQLTNDTGGFVFMYTSHERGVKYTISVHKDGFEPQVVSGSAPPAGHHKIVLKKADARNIDKR